MPERKPERKLVVVNVTVGAVARAYGFPPGLPIRIVPIELSDGTHHAGAELHFLYRGKESVISARGEDAQKRVAAVADCEAMILRKLAAIANEHDALREVANVFLGIANLLQEMRLRRPVDPTHGGMFEVRDFDA